MPTALVFDLRPTEVFTVPAALARATHAAILRLISAADSALASAIHDAATLKPLTVSNILGLPGGRGLVRVDPQRCYQLRVTLLTPELETLAAAWQPQQLDLLDLDGSSWCVEQICTTPAANAWADRASYGELAAPALEHVPASRPRWCFEFASPVTFRHHATNQPMPTPALVWGSLIDKWNAFAPIAFPEEVRRFAEECIVVSRFDLRTSAEPTKNNATQIGAVGRCTYTAMNNDRYWTACIDTLARFAFWSGIGAGATRGFGRARLV